MHLHDHNEFTAIGGNLIWETNDVHTVAFCVLCFGKTDMGTAWMMASKQP